MICFSSPTHAAEKILLIGDSHTVGHFGDGMKAALGPDLLTYGAVGISAPWYLKDPVCAAGKPCPWKLGYRTPAKKGAYGEKLPAGFKGLSGLLNEHEPATVVIELGTNDAGECKGATPAAKMLELVALVRRHGARCFWVGPPVYLEGSAPFANCGDRYNPYVDKIRAAIDGAGCTYIDSRLIKDPRKTAAHCRDPQNWKESDPALNCSIQNDADKYHFDALLGRHWGAEAARHVR